MPNFYGPENFLSMVHGNGAHLVDDAMRDAMILKTKETLTKLDGVRKSLELPPEALGLVAATYGNLLNTEVSKIQHAKAKVLRKKQREHMAKMVKEQPSSHGYVPMGLGAGIYGDELDDDDEA